MTAFRLTILPILLGVLLLAGCATRKTAYTESNPPKDLKKVELQGELSRFLEVQGVSEDREGSLLRVQARVKNLSSRPLDIEYRFVWLDAKGMEFDTPASRWLLRSLKGQDLELVGAVAPAEQATDYILKIKRR